MAATTEYKPGVGYKTTDENGKVTYSQTPPDTSTPPPPSNNAEGGFTSNKTKGIVVVIDKRTGKPVSIPTINGEIDPAFMKKQAEETRQRLYKEFQARAVAEANAKQAAELAEKERLKISNNYGISGEVGCKPDVIGAPDKSYEFGIGKPGSKDPGNVTVYNPETKIPFTPHASGCKISFKVEVNAPNLYERATGDAENSQKARDVSEKAKEIKDEINKIEENAIANAKKGMPPQQVSEQAAKEFADLMRKYGKEAVDAAMK